MDHMDHMDHMDMGGGSSLFGPDVPSRFYMQHMYWAVVGAVIAAATLSNLAEKALLYQRLKAARNGVLLPAKPKTFLPRAYATLTAIAREASSAALPPIRIRSFHIQLPRLGRASLVIANLVTLVVLCLYGFQTSDVWQWEDIGYRTGCITVCQLPALFLLAGKRNIVGWLTGSAYERLNWLHRWAARCMFVTATIHMGYWFTNWARYDYIVGKIKADPITQKGLVCWGLLGWIVFSSAAPFRRWSHEVFVLQHLASFAVFVGFVYLHTPKTDHIYVWIPVGLFWFDRLVRAAYMLYANISLFHRSRKGSGIWASRAEFTALAHNATRITIRDPPISWKAGQHMFLSCHGLLPLQSHPFTVCSIPKDGQIEFVVKAERGGTKTFFEHAKKCDMSQDHSLAGSSSRKVAIEGPYGRVRPLRQFDSVVFFAGSTGATFTVPLLRDLVNTWTDSKSSPHAGRWRGLLNPSGIVTRHIRFVWVIKSSAQLGWFQHRLNEAVDAVNSLQRQGAKLSVGVSVYVTCDPTFTQEHGDDPSRAKCEPTPTHGTPEKNAVSTGIAPKGDKSSSISTSSVSDVSVAANKRTCGPNNTCCCTTTIENENGQVFQQDECCCCNPSSAVEVTALTNEKHAVAANKDATITTSTSVSSDSATASGNSTLNPSMSILAGRPQPRSIIRTVLEQALGESAMVVCGPTRLVSDVRAAVVGLSDERAIHKGTGAQGVYLHTEQFGF